MKIFLNSNVLQSGSVSGADLIISFARTLLTAKSIFNDFLLYGDIDNVHSLNYNGTSIKSTIYSCVDREAKGILLSSIHRYQRIAEHDSIVDFEVCISFHVNAICKSARISVDSFNINNIPCFHSGSVQELVCRASFLSEFQQFNNQNTELIPSSFSSIFYNEYFHELFVKFNRTSSYDKRSITSKVSSLVAEFCGFSKNSVLCSKNSGRHIYSKNGSRFHLSTDFQHGTFEVLDLNGKHVKEINYNGVQVSNADDSGRHDINI